MIGSTSAWALRCVSASDGSALVTDTISTNIPVPADAPDGAVIWESSVRTIRVTCSHDWGANSESVYLYVNPSNAGPATGTSVGIRRGNQLYTQTNGRIQLDQTIPAGISQTVTFPLSFSVVVLKMGASPSNGVSTFSNFRVFQIDGQAGLNITPDYNINYVLSGNIRFVGCFVNLAFSPSSVVDFGRMLSAGTVGIVAAERNFSISATRGCNSPYQLSIAFVPTTSTPAGTVSGSDTYALENGVGLSIVDAASGATVPLDGTYSSFVNLMTVTSATKQYRARLSRRANPLAIGPFSATMVVNVEYY
ncbi:fimbrial protein [Cupriavidus pauculus]|uniref:fimbrial protein n=1 Tax=Cupriavidus pauculus TaxID=82633 RepID=UPI001EE16610|nr:fimbrial protein [Cupriavidus pauculus]GJG98151.1 fimbrial protein [Cupriavidus pauculus]